MAIGKVGDQELRGKNHDPAWTSSSLQNHRLKLYLLFCEIMLVASINAQGIQQKSFTLRNAFL